MLLDRGRRRASLVPPSFSLPRATYPALTCTLALIDRWRRRYCRRRRRGGGGGPERLWVRSSLARERERGRGGEEGGDGASAPLQKRGNCLDRENWLNETKCSSPRSPRLNELISEKLDELGGCTLLTDISLPEEL